MKDLERQLKRIPISCVAAASQIGLPPYDPGLIHSRTWCRLAKVFVCFSKTTSGFLPSSNKVDTGARGKHADGRWQQRSSELKPTKENLQ
jgi:hypothetical protein